MLFFHWYSKIEFFLLRKMGFIRFKKEGKNVKINYGFFGGIKNIEIGNNIYIGENIKLWGEGGIIIHNNTIIGPNVIIRSTNHDYKTGDFLPYGPGIDKRSVVIGENCWIGDSVIIAPGTNIGEGSIIGTGSVIRGDISPLSIIIGNPGQIIKKRDKDMYNRLKKEGKIYLKYKNEGKI